MNIKAISSIEAYGSKPELKLVKGSEEPRAAAAKPADEQPDTEKIAEQKQADTNSVKAVFAVDDDKNVVIRVLDEDGKVIRQFPPEEFLEMAKNLENISKSIFHREA